MLVTNRFCLEKLHACFEEELLVRDLRISSRDYSVKARYLDI